MQLVQRTRHTCIASGRTSDRTMALAKDLPIHGCTVITVQEAQLIQVIRTDRAT